MLRKVKASPPPPFLLLPPREKVKPPPMPLSLLPVVRDGIGIGTSIRETGTGSRASPPTHPGGTTSCGSGTGYGIGFYRTGTINLANKKVSG